MTWTTFQLRVTTPLFSGDDATSTGSPIRVPSIRGALRFWFRAVAAGHDITDLTQLATQETEVFGSTNHPSPIRLRIVGDQPVATGMNTEPEWAAKRPGVQYLLGQGLWKHKAGIQRPFVRAGASVSLQVRFSGTPLIDARFMIALWAWLTYGGLGSRVRRGFGRLDCTRVDGPLPANWRMEHLQRPDSAQAWQELGNRGLPQRVLALGELAWPPVLRDDAKEGEPMPEIPTLAPKWWKGSLRSSSSRALGDALDAMGREWRAFRAPDKPRDPTARNRLSPEWTQVIRGDDDRYPVGALGLPVGYHEPGMGEEQSEVVEPRRDGTAIRRASPVWLAPVRLRDGSWRTFTHVFYARLLPDDATVELSSAPERRLTVTEAEYAWDAWLDGAARLPSGYFTGSA